MTGVDASRWLRSDFARHVTALGSGTALGQLLVVLVTPLLTRLYSPDDMGMAGLFASFLAVASVVVTLRLDFAIATTADPRRAARLLALSLLLCPVTALAMGLLLYVLILTDVFAFGLLPSWTVPLAILALLATGAFVALRYWHVGRLGFREVSRALVAQGAGRAATSVALGVAGAGWLGLALGEVAGRVLGIGRLWRTASADLRTQLAGGRLAQLAQELKLAWRYPLVVLPSSLVDALAAALPLPMIAWLFGAAEAGQFALVWRIAALPGGLVAASFGDVFHAHATAAREGGPIEVRRLLSRSMRTLGFTALAIYLPACLLAPWLFAWLFGAPWRMAGTMMLLMAPLWIAAFVVSPLSRLPMVLGRPALKLAFDACFLVLPLGALLVFAGRGLMPAIAAYGAAAAAAYAVFAVLLYDTASRRAAEPAR